MDLDQPTPVELTRAEAIVLFEWLHQMEADGLTISENQGENVALWNLSSRLESILVEPYRDDYRELVNEAQQHLANGTVPRAEGSTHRSSNNNG